MRIITGAVAAQLALSFWMLAFSMFLFLSLALVKRYTESAVSYTHLDVYKRQDSGHPDTAIAAIGLTHPCD